VRDVVVDPVPYDRIARASPTRGGLASARRLCYGYRLRFLQRSFPSQRPPRRGLARRAHIKRHGDAGSPDNYARSTTRLHCLHLDGVIEERDPPLTSNRGIAHTERFCTALSGESGGVMLEILTLALFGVVAALSTLLLATEVAWRRR